MMSCLRIQASLRCFRMSGFKQKIPACAGMTRLFKSNKILYRKIDEKPDSTPNIKGLFINKHSFSPTNQHQPHRADAESACPLSHAKLETGGNWI